MHFAGKAGYELEKELGSNAAGALILAASGHPKIVNFSATNEDAMVEIRKRAEAENSGLPR